MSTRDIHPRENNEGNLGTIAKKWANIWSILVNGLSLTPQSVGFTVAGGTTSKTLTIAGDTTISGGAYSGTNTGDKDVVDDTTPQLGGFLDMNEKNMEHEFGTLVSDHTSSGFTITATAGENVVFGDVCYFKSDGKFWKTDADAVATSKGLLAMAIATINANTSGLFLKDGYARDDTWSWVVADELFLSTDPGVMTAVKPSGTTDVVRLVAYVKAADYILFKPSAVYLELS
jgi:hypothetical protein